MHLSQKDDETRKSTIFFWKGSKVHLREEKNREREREMQEAIDTWQTMSTEELHHNIRQLQVISGQCHRRLCAGREFEQIRFF